jgi:hypothetical protein
VTVQTEISRSGPYAGSGTTGPFTVGFRFLDNTHLQVIKTSTSGIDTTLVITTDYSVSGAGGSSGTVTLVSALASGEKLTIIRDVPFTQLADYVDNDAFPAESHESALDKLTMQTQQNREALDRSLTLPATVSGVSTTLPTPEANKFLGWNASANAFQNIDSGTLATIVAYGTANSDLFSGTGAKTTFTLSANPGALNNLDVSIGGVTQRPGTDYTWSSGTTLTFVSAPVAGTNNILVRYMQALPQGYTVDTLVSSDDGSSGSMWSTVAGFITYVKTAASAIFGRVSLLSGRASNMLIRDQTAGPTRVHVEPNGYVTGTAAKQDWMFDPYQTDNINYRIVNLYTKTYDAADASTTQGNNGVAVLGVKGVGNNFGVWPTLHFGFSDDGAVSAVPMKMYYFDTSDTVWRTPMTGAWRTGAVVAAGEYKLASNKLYQAAGSGTTGATIPSHAAGSVSDGGVTWAFIRDYAAAAGSVRGTVLFGDRDDLPKFGLSTVRAQYSQDAAFWNGKKLRFLDSSNLSAWSVYTNGATDDLYIETEDGAKRLRLDATGQFLQITGLAVASASVTPTSLDTTPSIKGVRTLLFNNAGPTSVTQFDDGIGFQEFYVRSANGQTTLVHGANLRLIGAVNKLLGTDDILLFQTGSSGTVATQVA